MKIDNTTYFFLGAIVFLIVVMIIICKSSNKSKFGEETSPSSKKITDDMVLIVHAPWCGHCQAAKAEFDDAVSRGKGKVIAIDATDKDNKPILDKLAIKGFPTIVKGDGSKFTGSRTADSILKFADEK